MKATGIVRRMDDLGRVVIPKEIRRMFHIREGDPLKIYTTNEGVVFCPYHMSDKEKTDFAQKWLNDHAGALTKYQARFTFHGANICTCNIIKDQRQHTAKAETNSQDTFIPTVGMVIAFCRAIDTDPPAELLR